MEKFNDWYYYRKLIDEAKEIISGLDIPFSESICFSISTTRNTYGDCTHIHDDVYDIRISSKVLATRDETVILQTIIHEILHTSAWGDGHKGNWKKYADKVSKNTKYKISRCVSKEESEIVDKNEDWLFKIVCDKCKHEWKLCRATKTVRACVKGRAKCSCGSKKFTVYNKYNEIIK